MDLSQIGLFSGLMDKMNWLTQRQGLIASNIANVDTPGAEGKDLAPFTFKNMMKKLQLAPAQTSSGAGFLQVGMPTGGSGGDAKEMSELHSAYEVKPDGNAISTEAEMKKAADTAADYQLVTNVYKKSVSLIELALGNGKG